MNDLISRQDAIRIVDNMDTWRAGCRGNAIESMKALPSAHPERCEDCENFSKTRLLIPQPQRKKGKWIKTYRNGFGSLIGYCNKCGRSALVDNYCPKCGADMREENR